jgi:DNA polymerase delta subunit 2
MPGATDPANYALPQQPLHPCLLPLATQYSTLQLVTNPHEAWVGGRLFLGTSGQPLEDLAKYTRPEVEGYVYVQLTEVALAF